MRNQEKGASKKRYVKPQLKKHGAIKVMSWGSPGFEEAPRRRR